MDQNLIYDVGMCNGRDTEFYLEKDLMLLLLKQIQYLLDKLKTIFLII